MKSFIQYLLDQKKLKASEVVSLLLAHAKAGSSVPEVIFKHALLEEQVIAQALLDQAESGMSFKEACARHQAWSPELERKVAHLLKKEQVPLTKLILERGYMRPKELNDALDEYLSYRETQGKPCQSQVHPEASSPALTSDEKTEDLFSEEMRRELNCSIAKLAEYEVGVTQERIQSDLREVMKHLHQLRGMMRYSEISPLEKLVLDAETLVRRSIQSVPDGAALRGISKSLSKLVELIWKAKPHFASMASEKIIQTEPVVWLNGTNALQ